MQKLRGYLKKIPRNISLVLFVILIIILGLIAFPKIDFTYRGQHIVFHGLDLNLLSKGKIPLNFAFGPSLDFYGGSESIYTLTSDTNIKYPKEELATDLAKVEHRLRSISFTDYDLFIRQSSSKQELVLRLPKKPEELTNFNQLLALNGNITFQQRTSTNPTDPKASIGLTTVPLTKDDIASSMVVYGGETREQYGIAITFKNKSIPDLLSYAASDYNNTQLSGLFLTIDGQPYALQSVLYSSSDTSGVVYFSTTFGNDYLTANLLNQMIINPQDNLSLKIEGDPTSISGKYDQYITALKILSTLILVIWVGILVIRNRIYGLVVALSLLFVIIGSVAILKVLMIIPITIIGILGFFTALSIWLFDVRNIIPIFKFSKTELVYNNILLSKLKFNRNNYWRYVVILVPMLLIINNSQIPSIGLFTIFFVITSFVAWLSYLIAIPISLNLVKLTQSNAKN